MKTLIKNVYALLPDGTTPLTNIMIDRDKIASIGEVPEDFRAAKVIDGKDKFAVPGFVNAHTHASMTLFRSYADDMNLMDWLNNMIWPAEAKMQEEDIYWGAMLAAVEMIEGGTTTFADMYGPYMEKVAEATADAGLRAVLSRGIIGVAPDGDAKIEENVSLYKDFHGAADGRITVMFGPHAPYTCPPDFLKKVAKTAQSLGADMVVADGFECAGHPGENDLGTMVLTPRCVEALDIPVICAGGVSTGRQMAAALMLGAEGVYMGTRFLLSEECPVLPAVKNYLVEHANEMETILLLRSFQNSTRMYKSEVAKRVFAKEQAGCEFKDVAEDMAGKTACKMFFENADVENCGVICCGQTSGLIHDVLPVQTIIGQMMHECEATIAKFA